MSCHLTRSVNIYRILCYIIKIAGTARLTRQISSALSIHNNDIVGYLKQVTFYYTHLSGVVTGEAFLFLASVTTLSKKVCVIHMILFCHNLQCHYYEYSMKMKSAALGAQSRPSLYKKDTFKSFHIYSRFA